MLVAGYPASFASGELDVEIVKDWSDIVLISFGEGHIIGLKSNGTIIAAGQNGEGQCEVNTWTNILINQ